MRSTHSAIARHARIANSQLLLKRIHLPSTSTSSTGTVSARQPRKPGSGHVNPRRPPASEDKDAETSKSASAAEDTEQDNGQVRQMTFTSIEELQRFLAEGGGKPPPSASAPGGTDGEPSIPPEAIEPTEKPKRRARTSSKDKDGSPTPPTLPAGLDVLWSPAIDSSLASSSALPPDEILNDALTSLRIALQPQTQHRATYPSSSPNVPSIEPSIALYCPIEGGGYIIDETVRELAKRTGADVLVLDAVQLAAGEWGMFGTSATTIQLPQNPLHFASASPVPSRPSNNREEEEEDAEEYEDEDPSSAIQSSILHFLTPSAPSGPSRPGRSFFSSSRNTSPASSSSARTKAFFDELLALPRLSSSGSDDSPTPNAPRIVYIRDTPTLAASSSAWYPHLLAALRTRRQGSPASKTSASSTTTTPSAVSNPTVLVLGMSPPLTGGQSASPSTLSSQASSPSSSSSSDTSDSTPSFSEFVREFREGSSPGRSFSISRGDGSKSEEGAKRSGDKWGEDEYADKQRASRLRERLRRWEKGVPPPLPVLESGSGGGSEGDSLPFSPFGGSGSPRSGVVVLGGGPISGMLGGGGMRMQMRLPGGDGSSSGINGEGSSTGYWRHATLVPSSRDLEKEREARVARRREINALTIRMAVGALGGVLPTSEECDDESREVAERMWEDWGRRIEAWATVRKVADKALGRALELASKQENESEETTATPVSWENVFAAWADLGSGLEARKAWMKSEASTLGSGLSGKGSRGETEDAEEEGSALGSETDELVERLKRDPDLDQHEQRLLGCIVDSASMPTSFAQVHLPAHTIDSVRTVVSLPLLYPEAFQTGVLKEHGMSGVLLFGPPGTGKTLLARALAKEAGCRMMSIAPSDVMDMYVGEGEKLVRAVFALARKLSPCVLFVDELDALFGARASGRDGGSGGGGGAAAHRGVLTEFMQEMDGLRTPSSGGGGKGNERVIVVGATNRPFDLDDAVLRRLPRRLLVDLPGKEEREAILKILLRDEQLDGDVDLRDIASQTESFSGSDLKHLCVSAALDAVKEQVTVPWAVAASLPSTTPTHAGTGGPAVEQAVQPVTTTVATPKTQVLKMLTPDSGIAASKQLSDVHVEKPTTKEPSSASSAEETVETDSLAEAPSSSSTESSGSILSTPPTEPEPEVEVEQKIPKPSPPRRTLRAHNFTKALREITPSASEALGTLADLRKWNDEFGEGRRDKKSMQVWGRGTFGFTIPGAPVELKKGDDKLPPLKDDSGVD